MNTNRISTTLSAEDQAAILTAISTVRQKLPFLIDLSKTERVSMSKLGSKTEGFVKKALDIANEHPEMVSAQLLDEMRKDAQLFESLSPIRTAIDHLEKQLNDTATQVGCEAYAAARTVYAVTKTPLAKAILRTAADDLGKRFGRKPRNEQQPAPAVQTPTPDAKQPQSTA